MQWNLRILDVDCFSLNVIEIFHDIDSCCIKYRKIYGETLMKTRPLKSVSAFTLFFFCWTLLPVAAWAEDKKQEAGLNQKQEKPRSEERFAKAVEEIKDKVSKVAEKASKGEDTASEIKSLLVGKTDVESLDSELKKEFAFTEKKLKEANLPKDILDRHYKFVKHYEDNFKELRTNLAAVEKAKTKADVKRYAAKAKEHLVEVSPPKKHTPLDPNNLPNRIHKTKERLPRLKKDEFEKEFGPQNKNSRPSVSSGVPNLIPRQLLLAANGPIIGMVSELPATQPENTLLALNTSGSIADPGQDIPTLADLSETPEIQFTQELQETANLFEKNPVLLYEFVRNNFTYDPYYGSIKGSQSTLLLQSGNDFDQASVLIALFRASGIPARYAYGTVEISIEKVMKWLGGISDPRQAGAILATNGIPAKLIISGGAIKSVQMEHVWTEVYVPYSNYRGLINDSNTLKTWIPLDPSFKLIEPNPNAVNLADLQKFDIDSYLTSYLMIVKPTTPAKDYLTTTINYVTNNMQGQLFYDLTSSGPITDKVLGLLPDTLPYPVKLMGAKFSEIPDTNRHKIELVFTDPGTQETVLSYRASWANVLHNRFTISYEPATSVDEQIIAIYGDIYSTPSYLINVKPILKVEGNTVAEGGAVVMAGDLIFKMSFIGPQGTIDNVITNNLTIGATHAIGLGSGYTTGRIITYRTAKLEAAATAGETGDSIIGEYLNLFALNYLQDLDSSRKLLSGSMKLLDTYRTAELMVGVDLGVSHIFGVPISVSINGLFIDVDYNTATPIDMDGNQSNVRRFQILAGMTSSSLEHSMFEAVVGVEAVSTIKALEIANLQGTPVHQIDAENIATKLPLLQLSGEVKTDIQNAINAGKVVIVSERNIQLNNWNGVGYIVLDSYSGAGAYMISNNMSGGALSWITSDLQYLIKSRQMTLAQAKNWILAHRKQIWFAAPVQGSITSRFGPRRFGSGFHHGVDFGVGIGTHVYAVASGTVTVSRNSTTYGNVIYIDHGGGVETRYAHNCTIYPPVGSHVGEGDLIALSGNTGHVWYLNNYLPDTFPRCVSQEGAHVHFEILLNGEAVDPESFKMY